MSDDLRPTYDPEMTWFWGETIDEIEGHVSYRYGRGFYLKKENGGLILGNAVPEDVSDEVGEPTIRFNNVHLRTLPLFEGNGYYATRIPPRPVVAQWAREGSRTDENVPDMSPNPPQ